MEYSVYSFLDFVLEKVCRYIPGKPTYSSLYPLHEAVAKESVSAVLKALETIPVDSLNLYDESALIEATSKIFTTNSRRIIKILLKKGADPLKQYNYRSAAYHIFNRHDMDLIKAVLPFIADVNQPVFFNMKLLHYALKFHDSKLVQTLLDMGAKFDHLEENTYLHDAVLYGKDSSLVGLLLKAGLDVNSKDSLDRTPLHYAPLGSSIDCLEQILRAKPEVNSIDKQGNTAINYVTKHTGRCSEEKLSLMLKYGCDLNIPDRSGCTPLHNLFIASRLNSVRKAELMVQSGADTNLRNQNGKTPLHLALENGYHSSTMLLIRSGADINLRDSNGDTGLHLAYNYHISFLVDFMIRYLVMLKHFRKTEIGEHVMEMINSNVDLLIYLKQCEAEIITLKLRLGDSNLTYAECFWHSRKVVRFARNDKVKYAIHKFDSYKFPVYGREIRMNLEKALYRRHLEDVAEQCLNDIFGEVMPYNCVTNILEFFTDEDLQFLRHKTMKTHYREDAVRRAQFYLEIGMVTMYITLALHGLTRILKP